MKIYKPITLLILLFLANSEVNGQTKPLASSFFQNEYLNNPALAGAYQGIRANIAYRQQFNNFPGTPVNQALTFEYGSNKNAGAGLHIYNEKSGIFKTTRIVGTYAYTLRLDEQRKLLFGLSVGALNQRISNEDIAGDPNDLQLEQFRQRKTYFDGDFGVAYKDTKFSAQIAIPQIRNLLNKEYAVLVNYPTFYSSLSYLIQLEQLDGTLEPKLNYRGFKGSKNVVDAGVNLIFANRRLNFFGMYHSTESMTFGVGLTYESINISTMYATGTSIMRDYANGDFEINLRLALPQKK